MTAEQYKVAHGLLLKEALVADDLRAQMGEASRARLAADPTLGARSIARANAAHKTAEERKARADERARTSLEYKRTVTRSRTDKTRRQQARVRHDALAREAGYESWEAMIRATVLDPATEVGRRVGLSEMPISEARRAILGDDWEVRFKPRSLAAGKLRSHGEARRDASARAAGYLSWEAMIRATQHESAETIASRVDMSATTVLKTRRELGL